MPTMTRIFNFSAGPAVLPIEVLEEAQRDLMSLPGVGMSILEISHRSKAFDEVIEGCEADAGDAHAGGAPPRSPWCPRAFVRAPAPANLNVQETENIVFEGAQAAVARINLDGEPSAALCDKIKSGNAHVLDLQVVAL